MKYIEDGMQLGLMGALVTLMFGYAMTGMQIAIGTLALGAVYAIGEFLFTFIKEDKNG
jgi:hypothetical protein